MMTNYTKGLARCTGCRRRPYLLQLTLFAPLAMIILNPVVAQTATYQTLYSFKGTPDGVSPRAAVVIGSNGSLYGTTFEGGETSQGIVFVLAKPTGEPWKETVLLSFNGDDGQYPEMPLVFGSTGALYGTTVGGGSTAGVVFELTPPSTAGGLWEETAVSTPGSGFEPMPNGPLYFGPGGTIYTTTEGAITYSLGQVIALQPPTTSGGAWTQSILFAFDGVPGGENPMGGVVSEGGSLFGTTSGGGDEFCYDFGCGVAYELIPPTASGGAWTETLLHTFTGPPDGAQPEGVLAIGPDGTLYGTTYYAGPNTCTNPLGGPEFGCGTVFQLTPPTSPGGTWGYAVIYNFTGADGDGALPTAGVVVGKNGALYGTTSAGGSAASATACPASYDVIFPGCGIVFELTPPAMPGGVWTETILHSFSGQDGDGAIPLGALTLSSSGVLYGTASQGGAAGRGTVFSLVP
jgi:uncharacterized repeat protein (TIGR03803 family)